MDLEKNRGARLTAPPLPAWLAAMVPFERYLLPVQDQRFHVIRHFHVMESGPRDGMPVVMLHGNPTWGFLYRKIATALAADPFRVIMPDLIGFGFSDKPRDAEVHTLDNHALWFVGLLHALKISNFILVGQDWGGPIGLLGMAAFSESGSGLVLANTGVFAPRADFTPTLFHRLSHVPLLSELVFRGLGFPQNVLRVVQGDRQSIRGDVARAYRYPLRGLANNVGPLALARMVPDRADHPSVPGLQRCEAFLRQFKGPSALVWGHRDPILGGVWQRLSQIIPDAPVTHTQAGHFLQEEVPIEIAEAVRTVARSARVDVAGPEGRST